MMLITKKKAVSFHVVQNHQRIWHVMGLDAKFNW